MRLPLPFMWPFSKSPSPADTSSSAEVPVALFAYNRPDCLARVLECLKRDRVPLIYAFSDGPRHAGHAAGVEAVRKMLRSVDWCRLVLTERKINYGLGKSLVSGITGTLEKHEMVIVHEDDLITSPGTYAYMSAALRHYRKRSKVMSVTAWTHPRVTPGDIAGQPYFDGRAECWVWGTWRRAWSGMESTDAMSLVEECRARDLDPCRYGDDLLEMAQTEHQRNIWAVRWLYQHLVRGGLCLRPPHSLSEPIGIGAEATNTTDNGPWAAAPLQPCPAIPESWPEPKRHPDCPQLWRAAVNPPVLPAAPSSEPVADGLAAVDSTIPEDRPGFSGNYPDWESASAACGDGYGASSIIDHVVGAVRKVKLGEARYERDGVTFNDDALPWPVLAGLLRAAAADGGRLSVLDFGGALASLYFQCRGFLSAARLEKWCVVEQAKFVAAGGREFTDGTLCFSADLQRAVEEHRPNVLLVCGVLPYLESPHEMMDRLAAFGIRHVVIDRTPFWKAPNEPDRLTVETVPPAIYRAKYPAWFFNEGQFKSHFSASGYRLVSEFDSWESWEVEGTPAQNRGFILERA